MKSDDVDFVQRDNIPLAPFKGEYSDGKREKEQENDC